ncbi:N-acetylmuramoyl-L-alanine amidase family protein [Dyadobacter psychrophilus]|uniref:N-acetylmuramoyl-L-alanine amidase n=1 Tax=Dyadobacter psychrophilus TaxID=651661 RepID=A0A1T5GR52_9BACT|nr:N-acetylmuramoyl-L-alanine amidase [Dyadobacter psychrophilus]SKC10877.1 N-acetylmuramoyl-L-alanine amidase [Dyadobacter psychrophilus]
MKNFFLLLLFLVTITTPGFPQKATQSLKGKIICIDPGHGGTALTDSYRVGPSGEREEWVNLRVGLLLQKMLEEKGAKVIMTRTEDKVVTLPERAKLAVDNKADVFVSIHHNATADSSVNFPIIYFHGNASENVASVDLGKELASRLLTYLHKPDSPVSLVSDFTVFATSGASVLRNTYGIPAILAEASFFTNANEEQKLKQETHNRNEAKAYTEALDAFFASPATNITAKNSKVQAIPPFSVFQEAERMTPIAKRWKQDYLDAERLMTKNDTASLSAAYDLFTRSARSFPDSPVAAQCHANRAKILELQGKKTEASQEAQRVEEYYVKLRK